MNKDLYLEELQEKIDEWKNELVILEDDVERSKAKDRDEYETLIHDLYRQLEVVESHANEIDQMSDEDFSEEKEVIDSEVIHMEGLLETAREQIEDV